ncbi:MAG: PAS domain-containing protein, partial [Candidatus Cloacimonadaceae bacterium]|nr:PAS domain-containing protein [Candidatus Cloacimonadaceae bacterium]
VYMGVSTILSSAIFGLGWRHLHQKKDWKYDFKELYSMGMVTHITMVALMYTLPKQDQASAFSGIALPVLIIYPFVTVALGKLHAMHLNRSETQRHILESEELFISIANTSPPMWLSGLDKRLIWVNQSWLDFTGRTLSEELDVDWQGLVHPDDDDRAVQTYYKSFDTREPFLMEYRMKRHDGVYRWIIERGKPRFDKNGVFQGFVGICIDNSDLRSAREQLQSTEEEYQIFFNNTLDLFCIANTDGYFIRLNNQWEKALGYKNEELLDKPYLEFVHPDDLSTTIKVMSELNESNAVVGFTNRYRCKNGSYRWIEWHSYPIGNRIYAAARDITAKIENEKEILRLNRDLEDKVKVRTLELQNANDELEAFVTSVAHDLKAPLRAIDGFTQIISEDYQEIMDDEAKNLLNRISVNVHSMDLLIADLQLYSRVSKAEITSIALDMKKLAHQAFDELVTDEQKGNISFVVGDLPVSKADKKLILHVWSCLISNAMKFSMPHETCQITISGSNTGMANVYLVKDNGIGFNPRFKDSIFGLFNRLHPADEYEGTGVGLAIVKKIMERHKGRVWAESLQGHGSEFYFSLPV